MRLCSLVAILALVAPLYGQEHRSETQSDDLPVAKDALRRELLAMRREDQAARIGSMQALKKQGIAIADGSRLKDPQAQQIMQNENQKIKRIDEKNRRRLKKIIDEHGWPGTSLVGRDGALSAWLIVQHADDDVEFQKHCLQLLEAAPTDEVEAQHIAYLTDRVLVNEDKPQRYGTQMGENFEPRPMEDPENVDQRRAEVGLPPLAEYLRTSKKVYEKMASGATTSSKSDE